MECAWPKNTAAHLEQAAALVRWYYKAENLQVFSLKEPLQKQALFLTDILSQDKVKHWGHSDFDHAQHCLKPLQWHRFPKMSFNLATLQTCAAD